MATVTIRRLVEFVDTDMAGVVHFTAYFRFMEAAEHAFFRARGLTLMDARLVSLIWPRVKCSFEYRAPLHFNNAFKVRLSLEAIGRASIRFRADILRGGEVVAVGHSTNACCKRTRAGQLKAVPIPAAIRKKLGAAEEQAKKAGSTPEKLRQR